MIKGKVIAGKGKGKELGFATANIKLNRKIDSGVYSGRVKVDRKEYLAAIFIDKDLLEAYILDFSDNIYGREIEVIVEAKIREVMKLESEKELVEQIKKDVKEVKSWKLKVKSNFEFTFNFQLSTLY